MCQFVYRSVTSVHLCTWLYLGHWWHSLCGWHLGTTWCYTRLQRGKEVERCQPVSVGWWRQIKTEQTFRSTTQITIPHRRCRYVTDTTVYRGCRNWTVPSCFILYVHIIRFSKHNCKFSRITSILRSLQCLASRLTNASLEPYCKLYRLHTLLPRDAVYCADFTRWSPAIVSPLFLHILITNFP